MMQKVFFLGLFFIMPFSLMASSECLDVGSDLVNVSRYLQLPSLSAGDVIVNATDWDLRIKLYDRTETHFIAVEPSAECLEPEGVLFGGNRLGDFHSDWTMPSRTVVIFPQLSFIHNGCRFRGCWDYPSIISPGTMIAEKLIYNAVMDNFGAVTYFISFSPDYLFDQEVLAWKARINAAIIQRIQASFVATTFAPIEDTVDEMVEADEAADQLSFLASNSAPLCVAGRPLTGDPEIDFLPDF